MPGKDSAAPTLRITEIFHSLQGESRSVGLPTVFVRLTGCPMRCVYCDTAYAFSGGEVLTVEHITAEVITHPAHHVTVTGGEPLAQPNCWFLLSELCDLDRHVSLETGGAVSIADIDSRVSIVLDIKTPASGELNRNHWPNIELLREHDQVKFVICDRDDYEWARFKLDELALNTRVDEVLFSPSHGVVEPRDLAEWILQDGLNVRMQLQMHKYLWGDQPGH
ncbi:MAG: 7-carboxy-7-deazaguanine synthase QueE [Pseudomonadales bacterium]